MYQRLVGQDPENPPELVIGGKAMFSFPRSNKCIAPADTVILLGQYILEKPGTRVAASAMLAELNGRSHTVVTGVTVVYPQVAAPVSHPLRAT